MTDGSDRVTLPSQYLLPQLFQLHGVFRSRGRWAACWTTTLPGMPNTNACIEPTSLRVPEVGDASELWRLVNDSGVLDQNSSYLYLLLCRDFAQSCVVAEQHSKIVGFVTAYRPPHRPDVLFIWQVCVCKSVRRQGVASQMLAGLIDQSRDQSALRFVEATVAPSNHASLRMFDSLATQLGSQMTRDTGFDQSVFPDHDHEAEPLIRIGPLNGTQELEAYTSSEKESHQ